MNSEEDSDASSSQSPSPPASPVASFHTTPPTLERLIQHFVSAKRALGSTSYIWRADALVKDSRVLIEEIAKLNARNTFTTRVVDEQVDRLYAIKEKIAVAGDDAGDEFKDTIEKLDRANERLERTLAGLRARVVDVSLLRTSTKGVDDDGEDTATDDTRESISEDGAVGEKTLYDFIDSSKHETLQTTLRHDIDTFNDARADFDSTIVKFEDSLRTITDLLSDKPSGPTDKPTLYDEPPPTISALFHGICEHATEMAALLGSLIRHYDLCITALKHTEGGAEAAKRAMQQADDTRNGNGHTTGVEGDDKAKDAAMEESLYLKTVPEPISEDERREMLRVLENDAQEVEDVVSEIRDRNREQESLFESLSLHNHKTRSRDAALREVVEMLHEMRDLLLPSHKHALETFTHSWHRIHHSIASKTTSLISLAGANEIFLSAYAELLREVDRRTAAEQQMRKVAEKANKELRRLYEADREARRDFMDELGPFLPQGSWTGAGQGGKLWEVREVGGVG